MGDAVQIISPPVEGWAWGNKSCQRGSLHLWVAGQDGKATLKEGTRKALGITPGKMYNREYGGRKSQNQFLATRVTIFCFWNYKQSSVFKIRDGQ